jgi:SAM-dependent methyltransferase
MSFREMLKEIPGLKPAVRGVRSALLAGPLRPFLEGGGSRDQWARVVQNRETARLIQSLGPANLAALEISGTDWKDAGFKSYTSVNYPDFDICAGAFPGDAFDVVIAEHVFEHLLWPYRAVHNVRDTLRPNGKFLVCTPFLVKIHDSPIDCSRWTEIGLRHLLAEGGFTIEKIITGSWGNRACVMANWKRWQIYQAWRHSLANEPQYPIVVWALATK